MSKRDDFINSLDKYELAFLFKYKLDTYMKDTQNFIKEVMASKGVHEDKVDQLITESDSLAVNDITGGCLRCHSDMFFYFETESDNMSRSAAVWDDERFSGKMMKETNKECAVCGYSNKLPATGDKHKTNTIKYVLIAVAFIYILTKFLIWAFSL